MWPQLVLSGIAIGSMYGLVALGFQITYSVSNTMNFFQGVSVMLGAVLCYMFNITWGWPGAIAVILTVALACVFGLIVERFAVRPFAQNGSNSWLLTTIALGIIVENLVMVTFGKEVRAYPSPPCRNTDTDFGIWHFSYRTGDSGSGFGDRPSYPFGLDTDDLG